MHQTIPLAALVPIIAERVDRNEFGKAVVLLDAVSRIAGDRETVAYAEAWSAAVTLVGARQRAGAEADMEWSVESRARDAFATHVSRETDAQALRDASKQHHCTDCGAKHTTPPEDSHA